MNTGKTTVWTAWIQGIHANIGEIRVRTNPAGGRLRIEGIPDEGASETRWRVYKALEKLQARNAANGVIAEIWPESGWAERRWELPIALAVAQHAGAVPTVGEPIVIGAVDGQGKIGPIEATVPIAVLALEFDRTLMLPTANLGEAQLTRARKLVPVGSIEEAAEWLGGERKSLTAKGPGKRAPTHRIEDVTTTPETRRALAIAAAGTHNILIRSPTEAGAEELTRLLPGLMTRPRRRERHETLAIHSLTGLLKPEDRWIQARPLVTVTWATSADAIGPSTGSGKHRRAQPGKSGTGAQRRAGAQGDRDLQPRNAATRARARRAG